MKKSLFAGACLSIAFITSSVFATSPPLREDIVEGDVSGCVELTYNMRLGSRDARTNGQVTDLQAYLQDAGYLSSDPTGYFGALTASAVKSFQRDNAITPNGQVGPITRATIKALSCGGVSVGMCTYAQPQGNCRYIQGPDYNPTTQCGMKLVCGETTPTTPQAPTVSLAPSKLSSLSPLPQNITPDSVFSIATFVLRTAQSGSSATVKELRFKVEGPVEHITVAGTAVSVVAGVAVATGLSIPISSSGVNVPVSVKISSDRFSPLPTSSVSVTLVHIQAEEFGSRLTITNSDPVKSNVMTVGRGAPSVSIASGNNSAQLGQNVKVMEFTVHAGKESGYTLNKIEVRLATVGFDGQTQVTDANVVNSADGSPIVGIKRVATINGGHQLIFDTDSHVIEQNTAKTFAVYATVTGKPLSSSFTPFLAGTLVKEEFIWRHVPIVAGDMTGANIQNFPTNSYRTSFPAAVPIPGPTPVSPPVSTPEPPCPSGYSRLPNGTCGCPSGTQPVMPDGCAPAVSSMDQTNPVVINSFNVSSSQVAAGQPVTFTWTTNLTPFDVALRSAGCRVSGAAKGSGQVLEVAYWINESTGSVTYTPTMTATYTLLCASGAKDGSPSTTKQVTVDVTTPQTPSTAKIDIYLRGVLDAYSPGIMTREAAVSFCNSYKIYNTTVDMKCVWNGETIYSHTAGQVLGASMAKNVCTDLHSPMSLGSRDTDSSGEVTKLQSFFYGRGYLLETPTGYFGPVTEDAAKRFQRDTNLIVTGKIGKVSRDTIRQMSCN